MTNELNLPDGWTVVTDDPTSIDHALPPGALDGLDPGERLMALVRHHVNHEIGEAWLFAPVVVDGRATLLFGRHDIDVEGDHGVRVSDPLGLATVDGDDVTIEWRWAPAPADATEESAPSAQHQPVSEVLLDRPHFEQIALTSELYERAALAAATGGVESDDADRLGALFAAVTPAWLAPFYAEVAAGHMASLGWDPNAAHDAPPVVDPQYIPAIVADSLGAPEAIVLTTGAGVVAAVDELALRIAPSSPAAAFEAGPHAGNEGLADCAVALRALADPGWVMSVSGLTGAGAVDIGVAMAVVDGETIWTAVSTADGGTVVTPDADADRIAEFVEVALDAADIGEQGPVVMPLEAAHMLLFTALVDEYAEHGDEAFTAAAAALQQRIDEPAVHGTVAAVTALASPKRPQLDDGFGLPDYLTIGDGVVQARPMMHRWAAWLARPRARLTITLTDVEPPDGGGPRVTGYSFVRTDAGLFVFAVTDPWAPDGVEADRRVDVAAIGTDVLRQMVNGLLGNDRP